MKICILGTGMVGRTLAGALAAAGHIVTVGTRDPQASREPLPDGVRVAGFADAAAGSELAVNALNGGVCVEVLSGLADPLRGLTLIDVANPLDFSAGFPPTLFTEQSQSLGERVQAALPETRVVKSLNTLTAPLMLDPAALPAASAVFLSGDDAVAKQQVRDLLTSFGWQQIIDLGGIETARGTEMMMPMWLRLMGVYGDPMFNWAVIRG